MMRGLLFGAFGATPLAVCVTAALAFGPTPGEAYRVWLDGHRINLTASAADDTVPVVSPDGRRVAFVSDRGERCQSRFCVHLYIVGSDGNGLRRIASALPPIEGGDGQIMWSPDSKRLVYGAGGGALYVITPGGPGRVIANPPFALEPAWSPDGRVIAFLSGGWPNNEVVVVTPTGRRIWRVRGTHPGPRLAWSATGRIAVLVGGRTVRVYNEQGRLEINFSGRSAAWSPDGKRLASITSDRLEVRALSGRLLFRKAVPGLHRGQSNGLIWANARSVVIGGTREKTSVAIMVDTVSGRISNGNNGYFGLVSPDRRRVAGIAQNGRTAALTVSRLDGTGTRVLARRAPCPDLVQGYIEWLPDGKSLVYDFVCQSRHRP